VSPCVSIKSNANVRTFNLIPNSVLIIIIFSLTHKRIRFATFDVAMLFRVLFWAFIIVILYRFLAKYVFPVFKITKMASDHMRQMQHKMEEMEHKVNNQSTGRSHIKEGDYIDYEEVK